MFMAEPPESLFRLKYKGQAVTSQAGVRCPPLYRSYALVSREQIARNHRAVRAVVGARVEVAAVVKADAYGHGALEVSRIVTAEGAKWLAVSSVEEGVPLRRDSIAVRITHGAGALTELDLTPPSIRFSKGVKGRIVSDR